MAVSCTPSSIETTYCIDASDYTPAVNVYEERVTLAYIGQNNVTSSTKAEI